jgi:hypothetical protein
MGSGIETEARFCVMPAYTGRLQLQALSLSGKIFPDFAGEILVTEHSRPMM